MSTDRQTDADALVGRTAEATRDSDVKNRDGGIPDR